MIERNKNFERRAYSISLEVSPCTQKYLSYHTLNFPQTLGLHLEKHKMQEATTFEAIGQFVLNEQLYMAESIKKALEEEEAEEGALTRLV